MPEEQKEPESNEATTPSRATWIGVGVAKGAGIGVALDNSCNRCGDWSCYRCRDWRRAKSKEKQ